MRRSLVIPFVSTVALFAFILPAVSYAQDSAAPQESSSASVDISTSDNQGTISIDGKVVGGNGVFKGDLPSGKHALRVTRDGYEPFEKTLVVEPGRPYAEIVSLRISGSSAGQAAEHGNARPFTGTYGGLGFSAAFMPSGANNTLDQKCDVLGATCSASSPVGGSFFSYGGYSFNPIGFELFLLGSYDQSAPVAHFDGVIQPGSNSVLTGPARDETYTLRRVGGVVAARVRFTVDGTNLRAHASVGPGLALRYMFLLRETKTIDGSLSNRTLPDAMSSFSPALTFDVGAHWRASGFLSLSLGILGWIEDADRSKKAPTSDKAYLTPADAASTAQPVPLPTPEFQVARGPQFFVGPYLGLEFGP